MVAARPLLRSLQGPGICLAEAGGEAVRKAVLDRIKNVVPPAAGVLAQTAPPRDAVSADVINRLTDPSSTSASLDSTPSSLNSSSHVDRPLPRNSAPLIETPVAQAVLAAASVSRPLQGSVQVPSLVEERNCSLPQLSSFPSPIGPEPGSPKPRQKPWTLASAPGHGVDAPTQVSVRDVRCLSGERQFHQSRDLSIVTASANGRKAFFLDTLALVRRLEAEGLTAKQAEAITHVITDVLHESLESAAQTFVSKAEMQKTELMNEAAMSRLKTELQSASDIRLAGIGKEVEGLRTGLDKLKSEIKYEVDKLTAGQRLDLNLERGRVKEEINVQAQETSNINNKLDREVNALKAQLEAAKFEVIRYCVGTLVSVSAVGLGMLRVLM